MKYLLVAIGILSIVVACSSSTEPTGEEPWTIQHKRHFQKNCKEKLLGEGIDGTAADDFCDCCLKTITATYETGAEAIEKITEEQLKTIEDGCRQ